VGNGENTRFREDVWLGESSLANQYPVMYNILKWKNVYVYSVLSHNPLKMVLGGHWWGQMDSLASSLPTSDHYGRNMQYG
jgi:hypothetical protein